MDSRQQQAHADSIPSSQALSRPFAVIAQKVDDLLKATIVRVSKEIANLSQAIEAERQAYQSVHASLLDKLEAAQSYEAREQSKIYDEISNARQQLRRLERQFDWLKIDYRSQLKTPQSWRENYTTTQNQIAAIQIQIAEKLEDPALRDEFELKQMSQSLIESLLGLKLKRAELEEKISSQSLPHDYRHELTAQYQQLGEDITLKEQQYRSIEHVLGNRSLNKEEIALISHTLTAHVDYTTTDSYRSKQALIAEHSSLLQELKAELPSLQPKPETQAQQVGASPSVASLWRASVPASASATTLYSETDSIDSARSTL